MLRETDKWVTMVLEDSKPCLGVQITKRGKAAIPTVKDSKYTCNNIMAPENVLISAKQLLFWLQVQKGLGSDGGREVQVHSSYDTLDHWIWHWNGKVNLSPPPSYLFKPFSSFRVQPKHTLYLTPLPRQLLPCDHMAHTYTIHLAAPLLTDREWWYLTERNTTLAWIRRKIRWDLRNGIMSCLPNRIPRSSKTAAQFWVF